MRLHFSNIPTKKPSGIQSRLSEIREILLDITRLTVQPVRKKHIYPHSDILNLNFGSHIRIQIF